MKKLALPAFNADYTVQTCAAGITISDRAQALTGALPVINAAESQYLGLAPLGELFKIQSTDGVTPLLTTALMGVIYKSHFVRGAATRALYDAIRSAPAHQICPLCGQRIVGSVDHYLPQALHPAFNLTPANLVPSCLDCNKAKLAKVATKAEEQTFHPYFDDLGTERWLMVQVQPTSPPTIVFWVRPPAAWTAVFAQRVQHHFNVVGLAVLYAAQAASELADISYGLTETGKAAGPQAVREHLHDEFKSRHARDPNSWKTALYEGLRDSDWFCQFGYLLIEAKP